MLSTIHCASDPTTIDRQGVGSSRIDLPCPPCLPDYQQFMRGVDRGDQLIGYYNVGRRSVKWWKRVFSYLVEVCALNAYLLGKFIPLGQPRSRYLKFRITLAEQLVGSFTSRAPIGRPRRSLPCQRLDITLGHWSEVGDDKKDCVVCIEVRQRKGLTRSQYRHETRTVCMYCKVHLCNVRERNCYLKYHTLVDYCT